VHAAWRTDPDTAVEVVRAATRRARTPEPLRRARTAARAARGSPGSAGLAGTGPSPPAAS
jgi:deoxyribonuclease V